MKHPFPIRLLTPFAIFTFLTLVACHKSGSGSGAGPVITGISPDSGHAGTVLTITGAHFDTVAKDNTVLIDTVAAVVLQASAEVLVVSVPVAHTGVVKVTTDAGTATGPVFNYQPDVVISGSQIDFTNGSSFPVALYWLNGKVVTLPGVPGGGAYALCVAGAGDDLYIGGFSGAGYTSAMLWKNGVATYLTTTTVDARVSALAVSGSDVYAAGFLNNGGKDIATVWKDGQIMFSADSTQNSQATAIAVSGGHVYIAGNVTNVPAHLAPSTSQPMLWVDGVQDTLPDGSGYSKANAIVLSGTDVYVAGGVATGAALWKNGTSFGLSPVLAGTVYFTGAAFANNQLYLLGTNATFPSGTSNWQYSMFIYTTSSPYPIYTPSPGSNLQSNAIAFDGSDMYTTGTSGSGYTKVHYYKNGVDSLVDNKNDKTENTASGLLIRR